MRHLVMLLTLIVLSIISLFVGVTDMTPLDLFRLTDDQAQVLWVSRFPRLISLLIAGTSMSIAGLIMQQLSRNKFVSPTTGGTDDSARLGLLIAIMVLGDVSPMIKMLIAFAFALGGTFLFMSILNRIRLRDAIFIPLVGIMFGNIISSATTFFAYKNNLLQSLSAWLQGDFSLIMSGRYELLFISVPLLVIAYIYADKFTISGMGEEFALNLGLNYNQVVRIGLVIVSLISAVVMITVGTIPFLGLVIPNLVTLMHGDHLRKSLLHTALLGAVFLLGCDILGRIIIYPYEIPIGLTVGVIGSGIFLYLLMRRKAYE